MNSRTWLPLVLLALSSLLILNLGCPSDNTSNTTGERVETFATFEADETVETPETIETGEANEDFDESEEYDWKPFVPSSSLDYPWDPGQRQRYVAPGDQRNADFSGRNLLGYTFNDVDARGANFDGADLRDAVFAYTKLEDASFRGADLRRASFLSCGLSACNDLTDALINFTWQSHQQPPLAYELTEQQLRSTKSFKDRDLSGCRIIIRGAPALDLRHFNLRDLIIEMDFSNSRMEGADLTRLVILRGSKISQEQLQSTSRRSDDLFPWNGSNLTIFSPVQGIRFHRYQGITSLAFNPEGADLTDVSWWTQASDLQRYARRPGNVTFLEGTLTKEQLYSTGNYKRKNLRGVGFRGLEDTDWDFSGQDLTDALFVDKFFGSIVLSLPRADFTDAIVTRTRIDLTLDQFISTWNYKNGVFNTFKGMTREEIEKLLSERTASEPASDSAPEQIP